MPNVNVQNHPLSRRGIVGAMQKRRVENERPAGLPLPLLAGHLYPGALPDFPSTDPVTGWWGVIVFFLLRIYRCCCCRAASCFVYKILFYAAAAAASCVSASSACTASITRFLSAVAVAAKSFASVCRSSRPSCGRTSAATLNAPFFTSPRSYVLSFRPGASRAAPAKPKPAPAGTRTNAAHTATSFLAATAVVQSPTRAHPRGVQGRRTIRGRDDHSEVTAEDKVARIDVQREPGPRELPLKRSRLQGQREPA